MANYNKKYSKYEKYTFLHHYRNNQNLDIT